MLPWLGLGNWFGVALPATWSLPPLFTLHSSQARTASDPLFFFLVTATIAGHARPAERWMADFDRTP